MKRKIILFLFVLLSFNTYANTKWTLKSYPSGDAVYTSQIVRSKSGSSTCMAYLLVDHDDAYISCKRQNGDTYSGSGVITVITPTERKNFNASNNGRGNFYPFSSFRKYIMKQKGPFTIQITINKQYLFYLGEFDTLDIQNKI